MLAQKIRFQVVLVQLNLFLIRWEFSNQLSKTFEPFNHLIHKSLLEEFFLLILPVYALLMLPFFY